MGQSNKLYHIFVRLSDLGVASIKRGYIGSFCCSVMFKIKFGFSKKRIFLSLL